MRRRSIDRMGNGRGQRPVRYKSTLPILDEDNHAMERKNIRTAIGGATSQERVVATQKIVREEAIRKIMKESPHEDSRQLAKTKLRALGYKVQQNP